jgi:diadenosine tetraphosphate (Ap4A) HIT family hydrolase
VVTLARVSSCIFCAIADGSAPADVVLDQDGVLAFLDIRPIFRGHTLVVPRTHVHVVPRHRGDVLRGALRMRRKYGDGAAAECARQLREALA